MSVAIELSHNARTPRNGNPSDLAILRASWLLPQPASPCKNTGISSETNFATCGNISCSCSQTTSVVPGELMITFVILVVMVCLVSANSDLKASFNFSHCASWLSSKNCCVLASRSGVILYAINASILPATIGVAGAVGVAAGAGSAGVGSALVLHLAVLLGTAPIVDCYPRNRASYRLLDCIFCMSDLACVRYLVLAYSPNQ